MWMACASDDSHTSTQNKAAGLPHVQQAAWRQGPPAHGEGEFWHVDERAQRRGLTAARAEKGCDVGKQAGPRGL
jgi:hypothetical protein